MIEAIEQGAWHFMRKAQLVEKTLPEFTEPAGEPQLEPGIYRTRFGAFVSRMKADGADATLIYADREHSANLAWLTGFEPRFEEALLIVVPGNEPVLLTGPENQGPAKSASIAMDVRLYPPMGLLGQDRGNTPRLADLLSQAGIRRGMTIAVCGWKYFSSQEHSDPQDWLEVPAYLVDTVRQLVGDGGRVSNGGAVLMNPQNGFRANCEIDQLARFEFAACHTSAAVKRVVMSTKPGMTEYEAAARFHPMGMPLSCHTMFTSGPRAWHGLLGPSSRVMENGDAVTAAYGVQGALNCRAGWLVADAGELPLPARDYVDVLVTPYFETIVEWLETIGLGTTGGTLDSIVRRRIGDPFFGVELNPGHLIHLDEWMHTPVFPGSKIEIRSGMAIQVDVIPATGGPYFTTNIEDGIAVLDKNGRSEFAEKYPDAMERICRRRAFLQEELGIRLKPEILPFSNIAGWLPPFWLSPGLCMAMR